MKPVTVIPAEKNVYRADIDGLRAIAVLCVLFFHFGVETFGGGFIGVDVFFVISGFLITRLIIDSVKEGSFTFSEFYFRRARRLLPALLFTIIASFILGCLIFSPQHLARLGGSGLHGLLSLSNFFFWDESGYFDADSTVKPLLHLWSLSVEEQFYLVWPITLVLLQKSSLSRFTTPLIFLALGVASWVFAQWCLEHDPSAAFYMLPSRIVEFCIGALMVWLVGFRIPPWAREVALASGLALIAYAAIFFDSQTPFPGTNALVPCLGTALALLGGTSKFLGAPLRSRPLVFTGLISYSLYLCHWPLYVFYLYVTEKTQLTTADTILLTLVAFVIATLMYRFVERPFRFPKPGPQAVLASTRFALTCALVALITAYLTANAWATGGWYWRFGDSENLAEVFDLDRLRIETIDYNREHMTGATFTGTKKRILVVGDSHARDVSNGLHQLLASRGYEVRMHPLDDKCLEQINIDDQLPADFLATSTGGCRMQINKYLKSYKAEHADLIIYSAHLTAQTSQYTSRFVKLAQHVSRNKERKIVVMDRAVNFGNLHSKAIKEYARGVSTQEINADAWNLKKMLPLFETISSELSDTAVAEDVTVVSKQNLQCRKSSCDVFTEEGDLAIWDRTHWTLGGSKLFMSRFIDEYPTLFE